MGALYKGTSGLIKSPTGTDVGNRLVNGYYTNDKIDLHGHIIEREAMMKALPEYREWGTVREMHEHAIGTAVEIGTTEWNWISTRVADTARGNEVLANVQERVYKAFSVGIIVTDGHFVHVDELADEDFSQISQDMANLIREYEYVFKITGLTLIENSIVDRPANPAARVKALSGDMSIDGFLPEINKVQGIDAIKSVLPRDKFFVSTGTNTHVIEAMGAGMEDQNIPASDETKTSMEDNDMDEAVEKDVVTEEVSEKEVELGTEEVEPTEVENEPEVTEEPEVEVVEAEVEADVEAEPEVEVDAEADVEIGDVVEDEAPVDPFSESFDKVIAGQEATVTAIETLSATIEDLVLTLTAVTEEVEPADEEEVVEAAAETEEESEDVEKSIEPDVEALADPVTDKPSEKVAERKGTVNTEGIEKDVEEDAVPTVKTLDRNELRKAMVAAAVIRAKR